MKSYSDDIPNVSSEELQRSIGVADKTNELVKDNLDSIVVTRNELSRQINGIRKQQLFVTIGMILTLGTCLVTLFFVLGFLTL